MKTLPRALLLAALLASLGVAQAQVAGSTTTTTTDVSVTRMTELAQGWSAKKGILGKTVYNDAGAKIGKVEDLIISPQRNVSYLIVGAGGFVGIGRHDVAIPISEIRNENGRILMPGASKESVKALPAFAYATDNSGRDQFIARTDRDLLKARADLRAMEKRAEAATGDAKAAMDRQVLVVQQDFKVAESRLVDLKQAAVSHWREFEAEVGKAMTRVRQSLDKSTT